jgi:hypothetical protein
MMAAIVALTRAMRSDSQAALSIASLANKALHHLVEKPAHTVTRRDSLNEYRTTSAIGR